MAVNLYTKALLFAIAAIVVGAANAMEPKLAEIQQQIEADYDAVEHLNAEEFSALDKRNLVIFDVREKSEFAVSHIEGAIQVEPGLSVATFDRQYGHLLKDKTAIFYCSVGRRSSDLASRVDDVIDANGATASYNLIGGLFQWHNDTRPLVHGAVTQTTLIHPYNNRWGRLIRDRNAISYAPRSVPSPEPED